MNNYLFIEKTGCNPTCKNEGECIEKSGDSSFSCKCPSRYYGGDCGKLRSLENGNYICLLISKYVFTVEIYAIDFVFQNSVSEVGFEPTPPNGDQNTRTA